MARHDFTLVCPTCWGILPCCNHLKSIEIDTEIVEDIIALNKRGYVTTFSCQGDDHCMPYVTLSLSNMFDALEPIIPELGKGYISHLPSSAVKLMATAVDCEPLHDLVQHLERNEIRAEYDVLEDRGLRVAIYCKTTEQLILTMRALP